MDSARLTSDMEIAKNKSQCLLARSGNAAAPMELVVGRLTAVGGTEIYTAITAPKERRLSPRSAKLKKIIH